MVKNVLITGGSRGIGAEAVRHFTSIGCNVVFLYGFSTLTSLISSINDIRNGSNRGVPGFFIVNFLFIYVVWSCIL